MVNNEPAEVKIMEKGVVESGDPGEKSEDISFPSQRSATSLERAVPCVTDYHLPQDADVRSSCILRARSNNKREAVELCPSRMQGSEAGQEDWRKVLMEWYAECRA